MRRLQARRVMGLTAVAVIAAFVLASSGRAQTSTVKALVGGTLIDGFGGRPVRNSVVLVEGERISAVGTVGTLEVPRGAEVISTEGMSVLPGLWDMHVHLMLNGHSDYAHWDKTYLPKLGEIIMPASAKQLLFAGVTSARDLGAPLEVSIGVRDRINKGVLQGATMYVSGPFIQHEPYPGTEQFRWGVSGVEDARAKVRKLADAGVNVIKLIDQDQMTLDEVRAVVDEAHRRNLPVVAHSHRPEEIRRGLAAGVDNFEHTGLAAAPEYPEDIIKLIRERAANMAAGPLFWTPTIEGLFNYEYVRDNPEHIDDPAWHEGLPKDIVDDIRKSVEHPERLDYFRATPSRRPTLTRKFQQLRETGVTLLIGTDSGIPMKFHSGSTWRELDAWVNILGVDAMTTIRAATFWPAVAMK
ncbi:MAG TPA: amidohydrolase family protein, partial [Vicinamibacterales bacterium]